MMTFALLLCVLGGIPYCWAQNCFSSTHECCTFPLVDADSVTMIFFNTRITYVTSNGHNWTLDAKFIWDKPSGEALFNGYAVCLRDPPYSGFGENGFACQPDFSSCDYQLTTETELAFHDLLFGHDYHLVVRVAKLDEDDLLQYVAPSEMDILIVTPDCYEETGDREYCISQPIPHSSKPTDVAIERMTRVDDTLAEIAVSWRDPLQINGELLYFNIFSETQFFQRLTVTENQRNSSLHTVYQTTLENVQQNASHTVQITPVVLAEDNKGYTGRVASFSFKVPILELTTPPPDIPTPSSSVTTMVSGGSEPIFSTVAIGAIAVGGLIALLILVVSIVFVMRRKRNKEEDRIFLRDPNRTMMGKSTSKPALFDENKKEIDPEFAGHEMGRTRLNIEDELGSGQFGVVFKAFALGIGDHKDAWHPVAVKGLKKNANRATKEDFLDEIKLIIDIGSHVNILPILGCITGDEPYYLITEYMKYGDLLNFLTRCREEKFVSEDPIYKITDVTKIQIAHQIARGMDFLSKTRYYHGDLAARNILVGEDLIVKISDFGMADDIYQRGYKRLAPEKKRPVKWVSLETNTSGKCSIESDVWSYGIVLYEIYTLGGIPYPDMNGRMVLEKVLAGYRMEQPDVCPYEIYHIMRTCWEEKPEGRPSFHKLYTIFDKMLANQSDYLGMMEEIGDASNEENRQETSLRLENLTDITHPKSRQNSYVDMKTKAKEETTLEEYVPMTEGQGSQLGQEEHPNNDASSPESHDDMKFNEKTKANRRQTSEEYVAMKNQEQLEKTGGLDIEAVNQALEQQNIES